MNKSKFFFSFITLLVIAVTVLWGMDIWITSKIRSQLEENNPKGMLQFGDVSVNLFSNKGSIDSIKWVSVQNTDTTLFITCDKLTAQNLSWFSWLLRDRIIIGNVSLSGLKVDIHPSKIDSNEPQNQPFILPQNFKIKELEVSKGIVTGYNGRHNRKKFHSQINVLRCKNVVPKIDSVRSALPLLIENWYIDVDTIFYQLNPLQHLTINHINLDDESLVVDSMCISSIINQSEFQKQIPYEKNWVDLFIPQVRLEGFTWKDRDSFFLKSSYIQVIKPSLHLAKDKTLPDFPYAKPLYSKLIRDLPITIHVDSVKVTDGKIVYDHYTRSTFSPGKVYIDQMDGLIHNITNAELGRTDFPLTRVTASAILMKECHAGINWNFYINNLRDEFKISGTLSKLTDQGINYFIRPALDMEAAGTIDDVAFNFAGDKNKAAGDFRIRYDDFHIYFLKKEGKNKQFFKSALINLLINNSMKEPVEIKNVSVIRPEKKSFWAYLWNMIQKGMRKTLL